MKEDNIDITDKDDLKDFKIEGSCYVKDKFIGTAVAKKITVNICDNGKYNLEDKEISVKTGIDIDGNVEYIPMGSYIIEKPTTQEVTSQTQFVGYDYMIKFNITYENRVSYPIKASNLLKDVCEQVGVECGSIEFTNSDYLILGNPFTNNEDCKTVLSNIAQLAGGFANIGRDNKVYIKTLTTINDLLRVKDVHFISVKELNLMPINKMMGISNASDEQIDGNNYFEFSKNNKFGRVNSLILRISGTEGENTTIQDEESIKENGLTELTIEDNYFLINQTEREKVIKQIWNNLKGLEYLPFEAKYYGYPYLDLGDMLCIKDTDDKEYISYVFNYTFEYNGIYNGTLKTEAMTKTQTAYKNTNDVKTKFKNTERKIDRINGIIQDIIEENTETSNKLSKHEQTIDSMKDTLKSQETKIETVESKADIAQSTADSATTKANNAQTSANNAQTTANTANTNAQNAQKTADANTTKITTNTTKIAEVEKTVDGITQSVSKVEEKVETVENKADNAQSTADTATTKANNAQATANTAKTTADKVNNDLTTKYYTKTETENKITQTAESTISEVSKTYSTKTETVNAKTEAINSANSSTDNKLKDYTVTSKLGTWVEQNYEYIKYAWNQISQYLKMEGIDGKATLNIYDENNKMLMSLNQDGQTFFDTSGKKIGTVGIVRENNKDTLAFGMNVDWNSVSESKSMAWGYFDKNGKFLPIFHLVGTYGGEGSEYGGELAVEGTLSTDSLKVIKGTLESGETSFNVIDSNGNSLISVTQHMDDSSKVFDSSIQGRTYFPDGLVVLEGIGFHHGNPVIDIEGNTVLCRVSGSDIAFYANGQFVNYLYSSTSDKRLKSNFKEVPDDLLKIIDELKIQQFNVNNREKINFGIIAQDFIEYCNQNNINPEEYEILGKFKKQIDDDTEYYKIDYTQFLILKQLATDKKIKELQEKDKQKDEIITDLIRRIETLEKEVNK